MWNCIKQLLCKHKRKEYAVAVTTYYGTEHHWKCLDCKKKDSTGIVRGE